MKTLVRIIWSMVRAASYVAGLGLFLAGVFAGLPAIVRSVLGAVGFLLLIASAYVSLRRSRSELDPIGTYNAGYLGTGADAGHGVHMGHGGHGHVGGGHGGGHGGG